MTRVADASLALPPVGVWVFEWHSDEDDWYDIMTMTLASDGTFTWSEEDPNGTWTLDVPRWELDLANYFINLTGAHRDLDRNRARVRMPEDRTREARFLRFAYAPMPSESGKRMIAVSRWQEELEDRPYGDYHHEMTLQQ